MPTYVVIHDYRPESTEGRAAVMKAHRRWLSDRAEREELLGAGSFDDASGAFLIFRAESRTFLQDDIATDPFVTSDCVLRTVVREWKPKFGTLVDALISAP
jgi:uncharacterized protein YciI